MLVISTATKEAYIAIMHDGKKCFSSINADCRQSEKILKEIDNLLVKNKLSIQDISTIGVVVGPGSFTGIRIGVALVKGIASGDETKKILPLSTFDFMAMEYLRKNKQSKNFACIINALSGKAFVKKFSPGDFSSQPELVSMREALSLECEKVMMEEEFPTIPNTIKLTSESLLGLALLNFKPENFITADKLTPVYIRKSQAEENN